MGIPGSSAAEEESTSMDGTKASDSAVTNAKSTDANAEDDTAVSSAVDFSNNDVKNGVVDNSAVSDGVGSFEDQNRGSDSVATAGAAPLTNGTVGDAS